MTLRYHDGSLRSIFVSVVSQFRSPLTSENCRLNKSVENCKWPEQKFSFGWLAISALAQVFSSRHHTSLFIQLGYLVLDTEARIHQAGKNAYGNKNSSLLVVGGAFVLLLLRTARGSAFLLLMYNQPRPRFLLVPLEACEYRELKLIVRLDHERISRVNYQDI